MRPMRVGRDDDAGLVAWLAPGTAILRPALAGGAELRSVPLAERFDYPRHGRATRLDTWQGQGVLKIAPTAAPWSVWLFLLGRLAAGPQLADSTAAAGADRVGDVPLSRADGPPYGARPTAAVRPTALRPPRPRRIGATDKGSITEP
jgi:hypothetical protein